MGALPAGALIHAVLQIINIYFAQLDVPEGLEIFRGRFIAVDSVLPRPMRRQPAIIELLEGDRLRFLPDDTKLWEVVQGRLLGLKALLGAGLAVLLPVGINGVAQRDDGPEGAVRQLVDAALRIAPRLWAA